MLNLEKKINEVLGPAADMVCPLPATDTTLEHKNPNPRAKVFTEVMAEGFRIWQARFNHKCYTLYNVIYGSAWNFTAQTETKAKLIF